MQQKTRLPQQHAPYLLRYYPVFLVVMLALGLQVAGKPAYDILRYERHSALSGELWRVISGHFVHTGWAHLAMNVAWLLIIGLGFPGSQGDRPIHFAASLVILSCGISIALCGVSPTVHWYVGLSGVLHGFLIMSAINDWNRNRLLSIVILAILGTKLAWKQTTSVEPVTSAMIGAAVIGEAHLYGGFTGLLIAFGYHVFSRIVRNG